MPVFRIKKYLMRNSASYLLSHVIAFSSVQMPFSSKYKTTIIYFSYARNPISISSRFICYDWFCFLVHEERYIAHLSNKWHVRTCHYSSKHIQFRYILVFVGEERSCSSSGSLHGNSLNFHLWLHWPLHPQLAHWLPALHMDSWFPQ